MRYNWKYILFFTSTTNQKLNDVTKWSIALTDSARHIVIRLNPLLQLTIFTIAVLGHIQSYWNLVHMWKMNMNYFNKTNKNITVSRENKYHFSLRNWPHRNQIVIWKQHQRKYQRTNSNWKLFLTCFLPCNDFVITTVITVIILIWRVNLQTFHYVSSCLCFWYISVSCKWDQLQVVDQMSINLIPPPSQ